MITAIIAAITALIPKVADKYGSYLDTKAKIVEQQTKVAELQNQLEIAKINADSSQGAAQLNASNKWFKQLFLFIYFIPFILSIFAPHYAAIIFTNWSLMPDLYAQSCVTLLFILWGIAVGKQTVVEMIKNSSSFFQQRRIDKLNRKLIYDVLRSTKGNLTQYEVDLYEKAMDKYEQK